MNTKEKTTTDRTITITITEAQAADLGNLSLGLGNLCARLRSMKCFLDSGLVDAAHSWVRGVLEDYHHAGAPPPSARNKGGRPKGSRTKRPPPDGAPDQRQPSIPGAGAPAGEGAVQS